MRDMLVFLSTSEEALEVYQALKETLQASGLQPRTSIPPQAQDMGSSPLQQVRHTHSPHIESAVDKEEDCIVCLFLSLLVKLSIMSRTILNVKRAMLNQWSTLLRLALCSYQSHCCWTFRLLNVIS